MPTLDWIGKQAVVNHHLEVPYRLLKCDALLSTGDPETGNLLVQGDNLLVLKALLPYYAGQMKCIYIDPPYNTGKENWRYNDNVNSIEIKAWLNNVVGSDGEDLSRNDKWLSMMYPRLQLLRRFLREDGLIFISIDDNEFHNLRTLLNEIFGERNFIATIVWQKAFSPVNTRRGFSNNHDYIIIFAKNFANGIESIKLLSRSEKQDKRYKNPDNDPRGLWTSTDLTVGPVINSKLYTIVTPSGKEYKPPIGRCWVLTKERYEEFLEDNRIWFGKNKGNMPRLKKFLSEVQAGIVPATWWLREEIGDNQEAKQEIKKILSDEGEVFDTPKPLRLIKRLISLGTEKDSFVLDSFSGSGTTGHAVLSQNKEDGGDRKFILVEMEEDICRNVTAERLKRVISGYSHNEGLGGGFRYCKLGEPLFNEYGNIRDDVKFNDLAHHIFFAETGLPIPKNAKKSSPLIGIHEGKAYYLLFNGVLGDKSVSGGNILTSKIIAQLPEHKGPKIIFGEGTRIGITRLRKENITFKQIPYEIKTN